MKTALILLSVLLLASNSFATNYHVAQKNAKASDENPGTEEMPWKTMKKNLAKLKPGDTLYVHGGTYRESILLGKNKWTFAKETHEAFLSGTGIDKPIRFIATPGEDVIIKGSDLAAGWQKHKDNIWVKDWEINSQQVFCDGEILRQIAGKMGGDLNQWWRGRKGESLNDIEAGSFFYDIENKKMYVWLKDNSDPNSHEIEISVRPFLFTVSVDYIHISGFKMMHSSTTTYINWGSVGIGGSNNVMENCQITWTDFGNSLGGNSNVMKNCDLSHNGVWGLAGSGWGNQVLDCRLAYNNYREFNSGWGAGGMKIIPYAHNWIVSGCVAEYNIKSDGIWFDAMNSNVLIQNNISRYNDGNGIHYEISERAIMRNNILYENKGRGIYLSNSSNCVVLHNICFMNGMSGICAIGVARRGDCMSDPDTGYEPARNNIIVGNILIDNCNPLLSPKGEDHTGNTWPDRPELIMPDPQISSNSGCLSDYNIFFRTDGRPINFWENFGAGVYKDLTEWQEKTGNDKHSIVAMPKFKDLGKRDFHPEKDSVAIQFVRPQMSIILDMDGTTRSRWQGLYHTAGPYEAPKELMKIPEKKIDKEAQLKTIGIGENLVELKGVQLEAFGKILGSLPVENGIARLNEIPFELSKPAKAVILDKEKTEAVIKIGLRVKELYILFAVLNPGEGLQFKSVIARDDGTVIPFRWENGKNVCPSFGKWGGALTNELSPPIKGYTGKEVLNYNTKIAWEDAGKSARLFASDWKNENQWLPLREIKLKLVDKSATVLILGISALSMD